MPQVNSTGALSGVDDPSQSQQVLSGAGARPILVHQFSSHITCSLQIIHLIVNDRVRQMMKESFYARPQRQVSQE
jgi:hypothetical protein